MYRWFIACFVAVCVAVPASSQAAVTIDGNLADDWGISSSFHYGKHMVYDSLYVGEHQHDTQSQGITHTTSPEATTSSSPYRVAAPLINGNRIYFAMEDTSDHSNSYQVGPFYGGQNYDAEFLGVSLDDDGILSFAIASGQRPDNGAGYFAPGDLMIRTVEEVNDVLVERWYGIELGGGLGYNSDTNTATDYANFTGTNDPTAGIAGSTYNLDTGGYTDTHDSVADQPVGSIWENTGGDSSLWRRGLPWEDNEFAGIETQIDHGTRVLDGIAAVSVNYLDSDDQDGDPNEHTWIEAQIDTSWLVGAVDKVRWAPSCANDQLSLTVSLPPGAPVPEPASVVVWGLLGLIGLACARLRRRRS